METIQETPSVRRAQFNITREEKGLRNGLRAVYPKGCVVELRRRMSDLLHPAEIESQSPPVAPDCPVAAFVASQEGNYLLAIAVFYKEIGDSQVQAIRHYCRERKLRFFPLERLDAYHHQLLDRVATCEDADLKEECVSKILPEARCPNCSGPLIHRIMLPTRRHDGLYYACAQHLGDNSGGTPCLPGFLCGASEIHERMDPRYQDLKYRLRLEVADGMD